MEASSNVGPLVPSRMGRSVLALGGSRVVSGAQDIVLKYLPQAAAAHCVGSLSSRAECHSSMKFYSCFSSCYMRILKDYFLPLSR